MTAPLLEPGLTVVSGPTIALATCKDGCGYLITDHGREVWQLEAVAVNVAKVHAETTGHCTKVDVETELHFFPHVTGVERQAVTS